MTNNSYKILLIFTILLQSCWGDKGAPNYEYMPNMYESLSYEAYSENRIFEDELSARLPVEGTIPRGYSLYDYEDTNEGYDLAKKELTNPYEFSDADMLKAKELYTVNCGICHGAKGAGQGILVKREKILGIPSYADQGRAITVTPLTTILANTYQPNKVLNQCGSTLIIQSQDIIDSV